MISVWQYAMAWLMSVPPPSCVPNRMSTGSDSCSVRSTTAVSNTTSEVRSARIEASTAPNTDAYTTEDAIDPDWSMASTMSRATACWRRPYPTSRSGITVRYSGRYRHRFAAIVRFQSMSRGFGRRVRAARFSAPDTAARVRLAIRRSTSATTAAPPAARSPWSSRA